MENLGRAANQDVLLQATLWYICDAQKDARCVRPKNEMYVRVRAPSVATHALPDAVFHQK